jgi:uncharacterized DUF497 family protein
MIFPEEQYVWDEDKALANERKHGITFLSAKAVFRDPLADIFHDWKHSDVEDRWTIVGTIKSDVVVIVVYTTDKKEEGGHVRIISARKATLRERREYESGDYSVREPEMTDEYSAKTEAETKVDKVDDDYDDGMADEYDFSNGVRGAFKDCRFPLQIDNEVLGYFHTRSIKFGIDTTEAINEILRAHVGLPPRTAPPASLRSVHENLRRHFGLPPRPVEPPSDPDVAKRR